MDICSRLDTYLRKKRKNREFTPELSGSRIKDRKGQEVLYYFCRLQSLCQYGNRASTEMARFLRIARAFLHRNKVICVCARVTIGTDGRLDNSKAALNYLAWAAITLDSFVQSFLLVTPPLGPSHGKDACPTYTPAGRFLCQLQKTNWMAHRCTKVGMCTDARDCSTIDRPTAAQLADIAFAESTSCSNLLGFVGAKGRYRHMYVYVQYILRHSVNQDA